MSQGLGGDPQRQMLPWAPCLRYIHVWLHSFIIHQPILIDHVLHTGQHQALQGNKNSSSMKTQPSSLSCKQTSNKNKRLMCVLREVLKED